MNDTILLPEDAALAEGHDRDQVTVDCRPDREADDSAPEGTAPSTPAIDSPTAGEPAAELKSTVASDNADPSDSQRDFSTPRAVADKTELDWNEDRPFVDNATALGRRLSASGDLFRSSAYGGGLMLASSEPNIPPTRITSGKQLAAILVDRVRLRVSRDGEKKSSMIPSSLLDVLLRTEVFLQQFRAVDELVRTPLYLPDFRLTKPGYNDGGRGHRILYAGDSAPIAVDTATIEAFLDVMAFSSPADRANAVAAALTVMLRNHFPGGKPLINATATKAHAGKDTIIAFAAGRSPLTGISYQSTDWAFQREFVGVLKHDPVTAVINVENARLESRDRHIASGFLERFLCDPEPFLFSTGSGGPIRRRNDIVVAMSTNHGSVSTDLMHRSLPIHLAPVGTVAGRETPIGNPKLEFLPKNRERIEAELRGMIERWKAAGRPEADVRHPFGEWARTIGGILQVNGFEGFLDNYSMRKTVDDPLREGLALLGAERPGEWLTPAAWAELAGDLGLRKRLIPLSDQEGDKARARGIGRNLKRHLEEDFYVETEGERLTLRLTTERRRFEDGKPSRRYRFEVIDREPLPAEEHDEEHCQ